MSCADAAVAKGPRRPRRLAGPQRRPEPRRPHAAEQCPRERANVAFGVVLEEVRVKAFRRVAELRPFEPVAAFRAARLSQAAEVVVAERAVQVLAQCRAVGRACRRRVGGCWSNRLRHGITNRFSVTTTATSRTITWAHRTVAMG